MGAGSRGDGRALGAWITGAFLLALGCVSLIDLAFGVRAADPAGRPGRPIATVEVAAQQARNIG